MVDGLSGRCFSLRLVRAVPLERFLYLLRLIFVRRDENAEEEVNVEEEEERAPARKFLIPLPSAKA